MSDFVAAGGAAFSSRRMDWETPQTLFDALNDEFHFTLDAASTDDNAKCARHYTPEHSGLEADWSGETVFCNPPYGRELPHWVEKCAYEALKPGTTVVMLVPSSTDTRWFHRWIYRRAQIRFLKGRLRFETQGVAGDAAPFPSMIVVMGGTS
jgi:phage N-6-adenine-methyltransferase